jgi:NAD(P)-dependent dehydrogenase (short-subunit alcohol dehydrogenase family)
MQELAHSFTAKGAQVTLALRHTQDGRYLVKRLHSHGTSGHLQPFSSSQIQDAHADAAAASASLAGSVSPELTSSSTPLNMARLASIHDFAQAANSSTHSLDLLLIDTWDLYAAGSKNRRWYTPQGVAGTAQVGVGHAWWLGAGLVEGMRQLACILTGSTLHLQHLGPMPWGSMMQDGCLATDTTMACCLHCTCTCRLRSSALLCFCTCCDPS